MNASLEQSRRLIKGTRVTHPILWDLDGRNHQNYGVTTWPYCFLIGVDGRIVWQGNPARLESRRQEADRFRATLATELRKVTR